MRRFATLRGTIAMTLLGLAALAGGCSSDRVVARYEKGDTAVLKEAPADGRYALYSGPWYLQDWHEVPLRRGDAVGFRTDPAVGLQAIAGDHAWNLTEANYVWK